MDYGMNNSLKSETFTGQLGLTTQYDFTSLVSDDKLREMYFSSDAVEKLCAAFLLNLRNSKNECEQILTELFPMQEEPVMDIDAVLDRLVLQVAKNLIDDYPANDPRWANRKDLCKFFFFIFDWFLFRNIRNFE